MAPQQDKVLRIGVLHAGKIVEERVLAARQPVTLGSSSGSTIVVPQADLPESRLVFSFQGDRGFLHFEEETEGRIEGPQGSADFGALVSQGFARRQGTTCSVPVNEDQRGRIVLGEVTLLWQFVSAPAAVPKPVLPKEAKGGHFKSLDRLFVSVLAASLLLHSSAYMALASTELPKEPTLEEIPDRYARLLVPERLPQPRQKTEEKKPEVAPEQKAEKKEPARTPDTPEQAAQRKAARAAAVAKAVQSKGILKVLGALGPGAARGAAADVFGSGAGMGDVASALSGAGGVAVASEPRAAAARKGAREGGAASIGELATSGAGPVALGAKAEVRVAGSVAAEEAEVDSSDVDQAKLGEFVRARMGLIKACYENALKRNPQLRGKISIRFTILATGAIADVSAAQSSVGSPEVAQCIVTTVRSWRTQFRPPGPVTVEYPFVFSPVN
jgi:TonB family protein